jgi:hypothetical protein
MLCICSKDPGGEGYRPKEAESVYEFLMENRDAPRRSMCITNIRSAH